MRPIAPSRKNIALLGGFLGLITGFIASIYREHNSGFVFSKDNLELLLQSNILMKFKKSNQFLSDFKSFITEMIALSNNKDLKILFSKTFYDSESIYINKLSSKENLDMIFINQISGLEKSNLILFTSIGNITKNEINEINQRLQIIDKKLLGIVLI